MSKISNNLNEIEENKILSLWGDIFSRNPRQINKIHQSDCELVDIQNGKYLAVSVDTIEEEIRLGFYKTPEDIGFSAVMASMSDLSAVGANPIGILCSLSLPPEYKDEDLRKRLAKGIENACSSLGTFVLGGDTNWSENLSISITVIGEVNKENVVMRTNLKSGDYLYTTGLFGLGSIRAAITLLKKSTDIAFLDLPKAKLKEGQFISKYASACMDTSDGLLATLDQLSRINQCGFAIDLPVESLLRQEYLPIIQKLMLPPLAFLASEVGEYELIFSIPKERKKEFELDSLNNGFSFKLIGNATSLDKITIQNKPMDTSKFRHLFNNSRLSPIEAMESLIKMCNLNEPTQK